MNMGKFWERGSGVSQAEYDSSAEPKDASMAQQWAVHSGHSQAGDAETYTVGEHWNECGIL